jgi:non-ribosomal peptide synthetase component F
MHHIISDGWSKGILINELFTAYNAFSKGDEPELPPLRIQYRDYAVWEQAQLKGERFRQLKNYWLQQFAGELPVLDLPADRERLPVKTYRGSAVRNKINKNATTGIRELLREQDSTLFMGLMTAVNILLYRYTGQEDIVIGTSVAGREHDDLANQVGYYLNTLALRTKFSGQDSYVQLLAKVKQVTLEAYQHQAFPFDELVEALPVQRDLSRNNLFDVLVVLQDDFRTTATGNIQTGKQEPVQISVYEEQVHQVSKFDLTISVTDAENEWHVNLEYNTDLFDRETINAINNNLEQLMTAIVEDPDKPLRELKINWQGKEPVLSPGGITTVFSDAVSNDF